MPGIDLLSELHGFRLQSAVGIELAARRRGGLDEDELAAPFRLARQQIVDRADAIEDALGVVEALDADGDTRVCGQREPLPHGVPAFAHRSLIGKRGRRPFDRDRIGPDQRLMTAERDRGMLAIDAALHEAVGRLDEIVAVELRVEAEDRAAEQPVDDLLAPRADAEGLGVRPGDVPEGDDGGLRQPLADHARQQREVIVLHEHDRRIGRGFRDDGVGEALVDRDVMRPVAFAKCRPDEGDVAERPEPFVGEAVIVAVLLLVGEPDAPQRIGRARRRHAQAVVAVDGLAVGTAASRERSRCRRRRA